MNEINQWEVWFWSLLWLLVAAMGYVAARLIVAWWRRRRGRN